jgi:hypothetical protein
MNTDEHRFEAKPAALEESANKVSERIIGCAYTVANSLGSGFLEKVYENALAHELKKAGFGTPRIQVRRIAL